MKRVFAIHDLFGIGKCSLTAAIPIISAAGVECNPVPTAVLSTHTGNIEGYTFRDLTDDLIPYIRHWQKIGVRPDTIYSGYLGSERQIEAVLEIISVFSDNNPLIVVDPAMADFGVMYKGFEIEFAEKIRELCKEADVITPNVTEAALLTGTDYKADYDTDYLLTLINRLSDITKRYAVLTGVSDIPGKTGCLVFDKSENRHRFFTTDKCEGIYYGTGDIFTSLLTAVMTKGGDCFTAAEKALNFTYKSIYATFTEGTDTRLGVAFEKFLGDLI